MIALLIFLLGTDGHSVTATMHVTIKDTGVHTNTEPEPVPTEFSLDGNYPNPFNGSTRIVYELPVPSKVTLMVFDLLGREVRRNTLSVSVGRHTWEFDSGGLATGQYIYRLVTEKQVLTGRMTLIR